MGGDAGDKNRDTISNFVYGSSSSKTMMKLGCSLVIVGGGRRGGGGGRRRKKKKKKRTNRIRRRGMRRNNSSISNINNIFLIIFIIWRLGDAQTEAEQCQSSNHTTIHSHKTLTSLCQIKGGVCRKSYYIYKSTYTNKLKKKTRVSCYKNNRKYNIHCIASSYCYQEGALLCIAFYPY